MKAIHASYLVAIVCAALGGNMETVSAQGDSSSEDFLIKTQLGKAPQAMHQLSDGSLPSKTKVNISSKGPACGPAGPDGGPPHGGLRGHFPGGHFPGNPPGPDPEFIKTLGLSDDQREKLHAIREKEHLAAASRISELVKLRHQLMESLTGSGKSDGNDALAIQRQINSLENANQLDRVASMLEAKAVFTDEQHKQLRRHMLEHEPFMGPPPGLMGPGGPMGGPGGPMGRPMGRGSNGPGPSGPMGGPKSV
ncbi:MAG: Spy/CpxP family protein refolding chaperone [Candidatus Obscuribacterales bacterium]|jgi:Spy/CpxP family protein refolding chaperone